MESGLRERKRSRGRALAEVRMKYFDVTGGNKYYFSIIDYQFWAESALKALKYSDKDGNPANYSGYALIPSAQGSGDGEVIGTSYTVWGIRVKVFQSGSFGAAPYPTGSAVYRWLLVLDHAPNGQQELGKNVMTDFFGSTFYGDLFAPVAESESRRFEILDEFTWVQSPGAVGPIDKDYSSGLITECGSTYFVLEKKWPQGLPVKIKGGYSTPNVAALSDKNIFLMGRYVSAFAGVNNEFGWTSRCEYTC